ncbi:hypothetical protein [Methanococcoides sp. FTZ1]|uniref:hypothetical protein n=1 Tax=Methanococcoides sp. FTZ1 TaxID=3439061 RepID=UPI003F85499C
MSDFISENGGETKSIFVEESIPTIEAELKKVIGKGHVGRARDIDMTIGVLKEISKMKDYNIVNDSFSKINSGHLIDLDKELQDITSIGPKISSFYLRDLICLYELENEIPIDQLKVIQPIDVWVKKVAQTIGIIEDEDENPEIIRDAIFDACQKADVSVIKFNQGAWYLGAKSFDVLIDNLENLKP